MSGQLFRHFLYCSKFSTSSILGSLLCTNNIADMFELAEFYHIQPYANDTQMFFDFDPTSTDYVNVDLEKELHAIADNCFKHNLILNVNKNAASLFCSGKKT